ncbi:MAG: hypothetical protein J5X21_09655 [Candidatus Accumulibacter sp.]|jgi:hypothetical protein|nr:hypothetical protein [Candidatus Accumulibacter conexus]
MADTNSTAPGPTGDDIRRATAKINSAVVTIKALHDLMVQADDALEVQTCIAAAMAMSRDTCRELDDALVDLGDMRNGFFDPQQA